MATDFENLETARSNVLAQIAALTDSTGTPGSGAGALPNKGGDGINLNHDSYEARLWARLEKIEARMAAIQGPFEIASEGDI